MDKSWFVFRQSHYPPPTLPAHPLDRSTGAICLGHVIANIKDLDQIINRESCPLPYPANMPLYTTEKHHFLWDATASQARELGAETSVSVGGAAGIASALKAKVAAIFQRSVANYWEFDRLDTLIVQPTKAYVEDTLDDSDVRAHIESSKTLGVGGWTIYMISGMMIAHGVKGSRTRSNEDTQTEGVAGGGAEGVGQARVHAKMRSELGVEARFESASDFVWAVRFNKITHGMMSKGWSQHVVSKGATFNIERNGKEGGKAAVEEELKTSGLGDGMLLVETEDAGFFVLRVS